MALVSLKLSSVVLNGALNKVFTGGEEGMIYS